MGRTVGVDPDQLSAGAKALKGVTSGPRPSADESSGFGSRVAGEAVSRYEAYWVRGQTAVDDLVAGLAGALTQAAESYPRRDAEDADRFAGDRGGFYGF